MIAERTKKEKRKSDPQITQISQMEKRKQNLGNSKPALDRGLSFILFS